MKAIRPGDRGPAVEDIQRRLRRLGYDLGPTGVDGVFLGRTADAVREFQTCSRLSEDAIVGDETWSALVDATFTPGDRMLYLRLPHFHGHDVQVLQEALNALGFACGATDGIFGTYCERALGEFQRNAGLVADGIAGDETIASILALRHVWEGKDTRPHSAAHLASARAQSVLARVPFAVSGLDGMGRGIADRLANLAVATTPEARVEAIAYGEAASLEARFTLTLCADGTALASEGRPVVRFDPSNTLAARLLIALESAKAQCNQVAVETGDIAEDDEHELQRAAVHLLDAVCLVFE